MNYNIHIPVLAEEAIGYLNIIPDGVYVDATLGLGGHAEKILQKLGANGRLIGIDCDKQAIEIASERFRSCSDRVKIINGNFNDLNNILKSENIGPVNGIMYDLGVSSLQLESRGRGFSFQEDEKLDMRMDSKNTMTAEFILNKYTQEQLADIFYNYGEEKYSRKIARNIINIRRQKPITTTGELADIVSKSTPYYRSNINPATKVFQALRIFINNELDNLKTALEKSKDLLEKTGRIAVISFHSLEDRIVKKYFNQLKSEGIFKVITNKPVMASQEEIKSNIRSRSAKLRAAEKL